MTTYDRDFGDPISVMKHEKHLTEHQANVRLAPLVSASVSAPAYPPARPWPCSWELNVPESEVPLRPMRMFSGHHRWP